MIHEILNYPNNWRKVSKYSSFFVPLHTDLNRRRIIMKKNAIRPLRVLAAVVCIVVCCFSCNTQKAGQADGSPSPVGIIYDTDIGSSTDDLFALKIFFYSADQGYVRLLGGIVNRGQDGNVEKFAKINDLFNTYYGYGHLPLGVVRNGVNNPELFIDYAPLADVTKEDGSLLFSRSISDYTALPEGCKLYRKLLAAQPDHSVNICATGFMAALAQLLESKADEYSPLSGVELVKRKVKGFYTMGGKFGEAGRTEPGYNFGTHDQEALGFARTLFRLWPKTVPMYFSPSIVGKAVDYPVSEVISDIDWTDHEPIKQVYMRYEVDSGQKMWDALAALEATEHDADKLFKLSESGFVTITDDGKMPFTPDPKGNCYYQTLSKTDKDAIVNRYLSVIRKITKYHK